MNLFLKIEERETLIEAHRAERDKRQADRIKTILHLDEGRTYTEIAKMLFLDDSTLRRYEQEYKAGGIDGLLDDHYKGGISALSAVQEKELMTHLRDRLYSRAKDVTAYVKQKYDVQYTAEGMVHLLHRLGFSYKKTKHVPGKSDPEKQKVFLKTYEKIKRDMDETDVLYFTDGSHPQHNSMTAYAWIPTGEEKEIKSNTGRERLNLNGALNARDHSVVVQDAETINADTMIDLFKALELKHPGAKTIHVIADNAKYNHAIKVQAYEKGSRVKIHYLPSYAPNLNLIERLWKFFHKKVTYNQYHATYSKFKTASLDFFKNIHRYQEELDTLLTENFHIIGEKLSQT